MLCVTHPCEKIWPLVQQVPACNVRNVVLPTFDSDGCVALEALSDAPRTLAKASYDWLFRTDPASKGVARWALQILVMKHGVGMGTFVSRPGCF